MPFAPIIGRPPQLGEHGWAWDKESPNCNYYQIESRATLNDRVTTKDTEQDLALPPSSYWQQLNEKAERLLRRKIVRDRRRRPDDTTVVVSVKDRSQRDLTKRFKSTGIGWTTPEKQYPEIYDWQSDGLERSKCAWPCWTPVVRSYHAG